MQFLTILLSAASLAAAVPFSSTNTSPANLGRRFLPSSNCGLDMYARIGEGATKRGIAELNGDNDIDGDAGVTIGKPGKCVRIYCGGKVGFYLCVDPSPDPRNIPYSSKDLGQQLEDTFKDCYGGYPENSDRGQWAFQFWGPGYNLLAHGNVNDCDVPEEY